MKEALINYIQTPEGRKVLDKIINVIIYTPWLIYFYYNPESLGDWIGTLMHTIQTHLK